MLGSRPSGALGGIRNPNPLIRSEIGLGTTGVPGTVLVLGPDYPADLPPGGWPSSRSHRLLETGNLDSPGVHRGHPAASSHVPKSVPISSAQRRYPTCTWTCLSRGCREHLAWFDQSVRARSSASLKDRRWPTAVARARASAESAAFARPTSSRPGVSSTYTFTIPSSRAYTSAAAASCTALSGRPSVASDAARPVSAIPTPRMLPTSVLKG